jgi:nucleotide-binding universal stress UspA family protein
MNFTKKLKMKTLLIATDLSENARHVATYGYRLAQQLRARVLLCHVMNIPAEIPQNGMVAWPVDIYDDMLHDSDKELAKLKNRMMAEGDVIGYQPEIICIHDGGFVTDVVNAEAQANQADIILIGTHGNDALTTLMIGNHSRKMIEATSRPLLLVPAGVTAKPIKRIAFGSDFKQPAKEIDVINKLVGFAKALGAELILAHIDQGHDNPEYTAIVKKLLMELIAKNNHQKVSYEVVKSNHVENGLDWLVRHAHVDVIAFAHREHGFLNQMFNGSHTQKASDKMPVPLLVIKEN